MEAYTHRLLINYWDAYTELIGELTINDLDLMKILVKNSIKIYTQERAHSSSHLLTPEKMHQQEIIKMKTYKTKTGHQLRLMSS
ncbi:MAG: hypothetical protein AB8F94_03430 [Saprospiraceae bacterium]